MLTTGVPTGGRLSYGNSVKGVGSAPGFEETQRGVRLMYTTLGAFWVAVGLLSQQPAASSGGPASLNYEYFKTKVQPIFLAKRPARARCVACHSRAGNNTAFRLQPLSPGNSTWNEDESRKNF